MLMFAERLNATRKAQGIAAHKLAEHLHISLRNYRRYESGAVQPPLESLVLIADYLNVSLDYLLGRDEYFEKHFKD